MDLSHAKLAGSRPGQCPTAAFQCPSSVAADTAGNLYVADSVANTIHRITPAGLITRFAGAHFETGSEDGRGLHARFNGPLSITIDSHNNLYVADSRNSTVRKITPDGVVSTVAGAAGRIGSTNAPGVAARFFLPAGIASDAAGNIYVADAGNHNIRKITLNGVVTTLAGAAGLPGSNDGAAGIARFDTPYGIAVDVHGVIYVADQGNSAIRTVTNTGLVSTLAGLARQSGDSDGHEKAARFSSTQSVAVDAAGNVYVADTRNNAIRKISSAGDVTTIAAAPLLIGFLDGPLPTCPNRPSAVALIGGLLFVCELSKGIFSIDLR